MRETVSELQTESTKAIIGELTAVTSAAQDACKQIMTDGSQAAAAMDSIRSLLTIATENATVIEGLKTQAEQSTKSAATSVDKSKTDIDGQIATVRAAISTVNQQAEAARATIAELTTLSATLQATNNQTKETGIQATAVLESLRTIAKSTTESAGRVEASKTQVDQAAEVAAARSKHIEEGRQYVDAKRAEIDGIVVTAQQSASNAEAQNVASRASLENLNALYTAAQATKVSADGNAEATATARAAAEGHVVVTKRLAEIAGATEAKLVQYEGQLKDMQEASIKQQKKIDELLLGATNAGLASAFDKRGKTFKRPEVVWQCIFVGSLGALVAMALWQHVDFLAAGQPLNWEQIFRMLLVKLPLVPLVWLAIHAARQASFAKRMEEEYAFKATISTSFEGYRREMAEVSKNLTPDSPLARLCTDTLVTISTPPGQIYDKHRMDPTPGTAAAEIVKPIVDGVTRGRSLRKPPN